MPALRVETVYRGEVVELATGWPVDYSETKIAFLLTTGKDIVIEKDSIWSLEPRREVSSALQQNQTNIHFAHPTNCGFCSSGVADAEPRRVIFAQQI